MERIELKTYYFVLDCKWTSDSKMQTLISDIGYKDAVSIYITIIDWLYQEQGVLLKKHYKPISHQIGCDIELVRKVVEDYDLFYFDGDEFSSHRARKNIQDRLKQSYRAKKNKKDSN